MIEFLERAVLIFLVMVFVLTFAPKTCHGGDVYGKYGLGVFHSAEKSYAEVKSLAVGYQQEVILPFLLEQYELGFWTDNRSDIGRSGSGYGGYSLGLSVNRDGPFLQSLWGVGFVTATDSMLGGYFQFQQDLAIGLKDKHGASIALVYKHLSSAGIFQPNQGRDLISIRLAIPIW